MGYKIGSILPTYQNKKILVVILQVRNEPTSGQNGSKGTHSSPLCTTTSKLQLKYGTTMTQNHQKSSLMEVLQLWNYRNHIHPDW